MKKLFIPVLFILLTGHSFAAELNITVSIAPQKYIAGRIGGDRVNVNVLVDGGADPHTFSPKAAQMALLSKSALYLGIGFPFEDSILPRLASSFKNLKIVDVSSGIVLHEGHSHSNGHSDDHAEHDPHVWTSPRAMLVVAENTYKALAAADPAGADIYKANYGRLVEQLAQTDARFTALFNNDKIAKTFLIYHPFLGYFAEDYGLTQYAVERDGKPPKAKDLYEIIKTAKNEKIQVFFKSPQEPDSAPKRIAGELGIDITQVNILTDDWEGMMQIIFNAFEKHTDK